MQSHHISMMTTTQQGAREPTNGPTQKVIENQHLSDVTVRMKKDRLFSYREFANIPMDQHTIVKLTTSNGKATLLT